MLTVNWLVVRLSWSTCVMWIFAVEWRFVSVRVGYVWQAWSTVGWCCWNSVDGRAAVSSRVLASFIVIIQWRSDWLSAAAAGVGEIEEDVKEFDSGDGEPGSLQDRAVSSVRGTRDVPLRRQVPVRARRRRTAHAGPSSEIQDGDVSDVPHDRVLSVRPALSLHPQRRRATRHRRRRPGLDRTTPWRYRPERTRVAALAVGADRRHSGDGSAASSVLPTYIQIIIVHITNVDQHVVCTGSGFGASWAADTGARFDVTGAFIFDVPLRQPSCLFCFRQRPTCHRRFNHRCSRTLRLECSISKSSARHSIVFLSAPSFAKPLLSVLVGARHR